MLQYPGDTKKKKKTKKISATWVVHSVVNEMESVCFQDAGHLQFVTADACGQKVEPRLEDDGPSHLRGLEFSAFNSFHFVKFLLLPAAFDVGTSVSA